MSEKHAQSLYNDILKQEVGFARSVAHAVIRPKPINVWEVLIPIVFILGFMRIRNRREHFVQNFIFTKKLALKGVRDQYIKGLSDSDIRQDFEQRTHDLINIVGKDLYSETIRQAQLKEIDLLVSHYKRLFETPSGNYADRIVAAYKSRPAYQDFIKQLNSVEREVAQAAIQTLGHTADTDMVERIESCTASIRHQKAEQYFAKVQ